MQKKSVKNHNFKIKDAAPEQFFVLVTGVPVKNLKELAFSFDNMNLWVYNHHVNDSRNDFAQWIEDVMKEKRLASDVRSTKNIRDTQLIILKHLVSRL